MKGKISKMKNLTWLICSSFPFHIHPAVPEVYVEYILYTLSVHPATFLLPVNK